MHYDGILVRSLHQKSLAKFLDFSPFKLYTVSIHPVQLHSRTQTRPSREAMNHVVGIEKRLGRCSHALPLRDMRSDAIDPITAAIVAALAAGLTEVGKNTIVDAYTGLKSLLKKKFGDDSKVVKAVDNLEEEKDSKGYQITLQEQIAKAKADQDQELVQAAQALLREIRTQPGGEQHIQSIVGNYNAMVSGSGSASVNVNHPKDV